MRSRGAGRCPRSGPVRKEAPMFRRGWLVALLVLTPSLCHGQDSVSVTMEMAGGFCTNTAMFGTPCTERERSRAI